jgi:excisionase family DNA binding protein
MATTQLSKSKTIDTPSTNHTQLAPILVSKREGARLLGVSVRMLERLVKLRQLRVFRIGRRVLIARGDLVRFSEAQIDQN